MKSIEVESRMIQAQPMRRFFFAPKTIWWPTWAGWIALGGIGLAPFFLWWFGGEAFLSADHRVPEDILVVEGWVGFPGVAAAKAEFDHGQYRYILTTGGPTNNRWGRQRWNYALLAQEELIRLGVDAGKIIAAPAGDDTVHRTFISAVAAQKAVALRKIQPRTLTVFTLGAHARRSRLVFAKVFPDARVGSVTWHPQSYREEPWWKSSERAVDLIKESAGWLYELIWNSGRNRVNTP